MVMEILVSQAGKGKGNRSGEYRSWSGLWGRWIRSVGPHYHGCGQDFGDSGRGPIGPLGHGCGYVSLGLEYEVSLGHMKG